MSPKQHVQSQLPPRARVTFRSEGLGLEGFSPLAPEGTFQVDLHRVDPDLISHLQARFLLELRPGLVEVPLVSGEHLPVEIAEGCKGRGWFQAARQDDDETRVTSAEVFFDPPLVLHDIVPVLARLNAMFEDHDLVALLEMMYQVLPEGTAGGIRGLRGLRDRLAARVRPHVDRLLPPGSPERQRLHEARERLATQYRKLAQVSLSHVSAKPIFRNDTWELALRFSGTFVVMGGAAVTFESVQVPLLVIPSPHASLRRLVSGEPLASATVREENLHAEDLILAMVSMLTGLEGRVEMGLDMPSLEMEYQLPDGGSADLGVASPGPVALQGGFKVTAEGDVVRGRLEELIVNLDGETARLQAEVEARAEVPPGAPFRDTVPGMLALVAGGGGLPDDKLRLLLSGAVLPGSRLSALDIRGGFQHPLLQGEVSLHGLAKALDLSADGAMEVTPDTRVARATRFAAEVAGGFEILDDSFMDDGRSHLQVRRCGGDASLSVRLTGSTDLEASLTSTAGFSLRGETRVDAFPELNLDDSVMSSILDGQASFQGRVETRTGEEFLEMDFAGSRLEVRLEEGRLELLPRALVIPAGTVVEATLKESVLDTTGLGRSRLIVSWDMAGESPLLFLEEEPTTLLVPALRAGESEITISPVGGLTISGPPRGLYDARYLNALLNPTQEIERWTEILDSDEAMDHVEAAMRVFSPDGASIMAGLRRFAGRAREAVEAEGITRPADVIPRDAMARFFSRLLVGTPDLAERIAPIIKQVTEGDGLDIAETRRLLDEVLAENEYGFELDRGLKLLDLLLSPTAPVPPMEPEELPPMAQLPEYRSLLASLPSAGRIYSVVSGADPIPEGFSKAVARIAPYLTMEQVQWLEGRGRTDWRLQDLQRLQLVKELKTRIRMISQSYGGLGYTPQALAIAIFLGATAFRTPLAGEVEEPVEGEPEGLLATPRCLLGPEDVAVLLQAGLAAPVQWRFVQLNQRHLLDLVLAEPPEFLRQVLVELCAGKPRILAGALNALINMEQSALRERLDLVELFSERLGLEIPRLKDYLAGGRWARRSYYEAMNRTAEKILDEAGSYKALRAWLQEERHPAPAVGEIPQEAQDRCIEAIARADELGRKCSFRGAEPKRRASAAEAYEEAFLACRAFLEEHPGGLRLPWLKDFWARNQEALTVLSVVRNIQDGVDRTREWFRVMAGHAPPRSEQRLVEEVIEVLYDRPEDQAVLRADPLVRLLLDPPAGRYDFTVVSCMGVVTEGAAGRELEDAFRRLEEKRGVRVIRSDTATARSLEFNATRVEEAVRQVTTPWGYIGYSQGCANGLRMEVRLMGGTPDEQAMLDGLRCRHFLFSAINGSAHGTAGDTKFLEAMVEGDHFLSHYQAVLSNRAIKVALGLLRFLLDSEPLVATMGGIESLSREGVRQLGREGQVKPTAPTTMVRAVMRPQVVPEALEFLSSVLTHQSGTDRHDTQVMEDEALGHPVFVQNPWATVMTELDMGARVQVSHHWSPLNRTTDFITTARDRERCIYDFPKDRHVFPWIEVNARFGLIGMMEDG